MDKLRLYSRRSSGEMSCACIFDTWSVPCFRVEFRSVLVRSVPGNRDGHRVHILHPIRAATTRNQTRPPPKSAQRNPLPHFRVSRRESQCTRIYTRITVLVAWENFAFFSCCALIGVQIKRHVLNGFPDSVAKTTELVTA